MHRFGRGWYSCTFGSFSLAITRRPYSVLAVWRGVAGTGEGCIPMLAMVT